MKEKFSALSFGDVAYLEHSPIVSLDIPPQSPQTIVAFHGWLDNAASFIPLMKALPEFHWIAVDLPGHGLSSHRPAGAHYHFIDYVSDIVEFLEHLNLPEPPIIIGHSLGGLLSTVLAGVYPERIKKLVLIDAAGLYTQDKHTVIADMQAGFASRLDINSKKTKQPVNLDAAVKARQKAGDLSYQTAKLLVERNTLYNEALGQLTWRTDPRLRTKSPLRIDEHAAMEIIKNISVPVYIVIGSEGYEFVKDNVEKYQPFYRELTTIIVTGNHHVHLENPTETAAHIKKFLL